MNVSFEDVDDECFVGDGRDNTFVGTAMLIVLLGDVMDDTLVGRQ